MLGLESGGLLVHVMVAVAFDLFINSFTQYTPYVSRNESAYGRAHTRPL